MISGSIAQDCLFCPFEPSYLIQSRLFANLVALVRAEKFVDSHVAHVCVAKSGLFAVDARVGQAELVAALHPLKVHHHQKATWGKRKCHEWLPVTWLRDTCYVMGPMTKSLNQLLIDVDRSSIVVPLLEVGVVWEERLHIVVARCTFPVVNLHHAHL